MSNDKNIKIAVIGLGYVGLPLAVEFGKKFQVVGFDISRNRISELLDGVDSTFEVTSGESIIQKVFASLILWRMFEYAIFL